MEDADESKKAELEAKEKALQDAMAEQAAKAK